MATSNNQTTSFIELIKSFRRSSSNETKIEEKMLSVLQEINKNIKKLNTNRIYNSLVSSAPNNNEMIKKSVESKEPAPKLGTFKDFIGGASERLTDYKNFFLNRENTDSKEEKRIELENKIDKPNNETSSESKDDTNKLSIDLQKKSIEILDDILGELTLSRKIAEGSLKRDNKGETAGRYRDTKTGQLIGIGIERASENDIERIKKIKKETEEKAKPLIQKESQLERKEIRQVTKEFNDGKMSKSKYNESVANIKEKYKESKAKIKQDSNLEASRLIKQSRTGFLGDNSVVAAKSNSSSTSQQSGLFNNKIAEDISSMRKAMLGDGIAVKIMNPEEIKIEGGGGGGGGIGGILPDIGLPGRGRIESPGRASIGSRALNFMTGTGGKVLGAAAAVGLGAYTAYSGYTEAEEKKQQEVQAIDEKVKSGEITPKKAEELKKEVSAKTTEDKSGAIGKGTGMAAGAIGGGIAGAKVGATIGTFLGGPLGTAIGGAVGGLAGGAIGAISGSSVGQNIGGVIGKGVAGVKGFLGIKDSEEITKTSERVEKETTDIQFSEMEFAKNDPENYKKFVEYREQLTKELYEKELKARKLTEKSSPVILRDIKQEVQLKAKIEAIKKFKKEIEAAGAGSTKTEQKSTEGKKSESIGMLSDGTPIRGESGTDVVAAQKTTREMVGSSTLEAKSPATSSITSSNQQGTTVTSARPDETKVTTSKESFKGTFIANEPVVPGKPLSEKQMAVIEMAKSMGNTYSPEIEAQYQKQKGEQKQPSAKQDTSAVTSAPSTVTSATSSITSSNQQGTTVTSAPSARPDETKVTTSKESFKGTFIANEPVVPGKPLSEKQMAVIEMAKSMGNTYSPEIEAQYQKQKSEQVTPVTNTVESSKTVNKSEPLSTMSQENQELKREQSAPIVAPPIISNNVQSTNTQTLAPIKAQPRSATSSSLEKYIERTAVYA